MSILAGFSAMAYRGIAADLRMSSAINTVTSALDNARAMAIKNNRYVITVFRPRLDRDGTEQVIDIVVAEWNGDSANADNGFNSNATMWTYDRFTPVSGLQIRTIEGGVNIAGPGYGIQGNDHIWWVSTYLPALVTDEYEGSLIGVLYSPEGRVVVRNAESGADRIWVDFNNDGVQTISDILVVDWPWPSPIPNLGSGDFFELLVPEGEPFISMTHILAVFNETECRSSYDVSTWASESTREGNYTDYINSTTDRIQFNRYSGVPLK